MLWLLEELGVPFEIVRYERDPDTMLAPPALKNIHPLGKSPVITDNGKTIAETGAIVAYIVETYGDGRLVPPAGTEDRLKYTYWLHYAEGSAMPPLLLKLVFNRLASQPAPFFIKPLLRQISKRVQDSYIDPQLALHMGYWEKELSKTSWFAGEEFTAADIQMSFPVEAAASRAEFGDRYPRLRAFLERIHARPAYRRALERGGAYELAQG